MASEMTSKTMGDVIDLSAQGAPYGLYRRTGEFS
jgi:hypothetical protein